MVNYPVGGNIHLLNNWGQLELSGQTSPVLKRISQLIRKA